MGLEKWFSPRSRPTIEPVLSEADLKFLQEKAIADLLKFANEWDVLESGDYTAIGKIKEKERGFKSGDSFTVKKGKEFDGQAFISVYRNVPKLGRIHLFTHVKPEPGTKQDDYINLTSYDPNTRVNAQITYKNGAFPPMMSSTRIMRVLEAAPKAIEMVRVPQRGV